MQCDEFECEASTSSTNSNSIAKMSDLDAALEEIRKITALNSANKTLDSTKAYCGDRRSFCESLVKIDSRYVSSVSIGLRMKSINSQRHRMRPYVILRHGEERHRTRSENSDILETNTSLVASVIDTVVNVATDEVQNIKKSKSLEDVHLENKCENQSQPEVELMSTSIQKLKMAE